jgi:signal transduction histidine kinase
MALTAMVRDLRGMSAARQEHLFDLARSRSRAGTEGERGTGFGMPLMHRFVQHYGGRASVTSRDEENHPDDHGTEFAIVLRRAARGGQAATS